MKNLIFPLIVFSISSYGQNAGPVVAPNRQFLTNLFNPYTDSVNASYDYSYRWDFDGDKENDRLYFIGNGGAHIYFFPRIILSSDDLVTDFPDLEIDMPYFEEGDRVSDNSQLVIGDFDADGKKDIYLNIDRPYFKLSARLKQRNMASSRIVLSYFEGKWVCADFK